MAQQNAEPEGKYTERNKEDGNNNKNATKQWINEQKQSLCTCVYILVHSLASSAKQQREMTKVLGCLENANRDG